MCSSSMTAAWCGRNTSRSASSTTACASSRTDSLADDRVIVNGLMHARPGMKVKAQEQGAPGRRRPSRATKPRLVRATG